MEANYAIDFHDLIVVPLYCFHFTFHIFQFHFALFFHVLSFLLFCCLKPTAGCYHSFKNARQ